MQSTLEDSSPDAVWRELAPLLDEAMAHLDATDRDAVVLRYFEKQDLRAVGSALGISEDAAQKRVSRAVGRLREFFAKRGVSIGASGLAVAIAANAVQTAPVGLVATISTAAALAGTTLAATATATKAIAMTTLQKTLVTATVAVLAGVAIYEAQQASIARAQVQTFRQQEAEEIQQLTRDRDEATNRLASLRDENERLNRNSAELLRLRSEIGSLRQQAGGLDKLREENKELLAQLAVAKDPSLLLAPEDRGELHQMHMINATKQLVLGMRIYAGDHNGQFPTDLDQLKASGSVGSEGTNFTSFKFKYITGVPDNIGLDVFELVYKGLEKDVTPKTVLVRERVPRQDLPGETPKRCYGFYDLKVQCYGALNGSWEVLDKELGIRP